MVSRQRQDQILTGTVQNLPHGEQIETRSDSDWNSTESTSRRVDRDKIRLLLEQYRNYLMVSRQRQDQILTGIVQKLPHGEQIETRSDSDWNNTETTSRRVDRDKIRLLLEQYRIYLMVSRQRQDQILTGTVQKLPHGEQIETRSDYYWNSIFYLLQFNFFGILSCVF